MKQKEIYIEPSLNLETQKMAVMYFAVKTVNEVQGFVYSEDEFLKKYKNSYMMNDLRTARFYAIYQVDRCENCRQSYELIINSRSQLSNYIQASHDICNVCLCYQASTENILGYRMK